METTVAFIDQFNKGMQRVMALRSPEIMKLMPQVEAMTFEARVAMVRRGHANLAALVKGWDKFASIMSAQGMERADIKRRLKGLRSAKNHLDDALRLADPKLPPQYKGQAEAAFNVLTAAFMRDAENIHSILTGPRITPQTFAEVLLPAFDSSIARSATTSYEVRHDEVVDQVEEVVMDGPTGARTAPEGEVTDLITERGGDRVS